MAANDTWVGATLLVRLSGRPVALLFNYDALAPSGEQALPAPVRDRLRRLARTAGLSVGVLGGREPDDLDDPFLVAHDWDKGTTVRRILDQLPAHVFPVYFVGADDGAAMAATHAVGGVSVAVGAGAPAGAHYRVDSPETIHADLATLCAALDLLHGRLGPFDRAELLDDRTTRPREMEILT
jgi:hypothetical protein